jgi:cation transport regulator ChaC
MSHLNYIERQRIDDALSRYLEMDAVNRAALIEDMAATGELRVFGYGSLMGNPHIPPELQYQGTVAGLRRDAIFYDRHYRGTPETMGVTLGVIPSLDPAERLNGLVLVTKIEDHGNFAAHALGSIRAFAKRETSFNPIYIYHLVDVEGPQGIVKAIICGTSTDTPQYLGPTVEQGGFGYLKFDEKAFKIADSVGVIGASTRNTGLSYWRYILDCTYKAGLEPEPHIKKLVSMANTIRASDAYRKVTTAEHIALLEQLEDTPERAAFDPRVFETDPSINVSVENLWSLIEWLPMKFRARDYLDHSRFEDICSRMRELGVSLPVAMPI